MIFMWCEFGGSLPSGNTNFESVSGPNCQHFLGKEQIESRAPRAGRAMTPPHSICAPCTTLVFVFEFYRKTTRILMTNLVVVRRSLTVIAKRIVFFQVPAPAVWQLESCHQWNGLVGKHALYMASEKLKTSCITDSGKEFSFSIWALCEMPTISSRGTLAICRSQTQWLNIFISQLRVGGICVVLLGKNRKGLTLKHPCRFSQIPFLFSRLSIEFSFRHCGSRWDGTCLSNFIRGVIMAWRSGYSQE